MVPTTGANECEMLDKINSKSTDRDINLGYHYRLLPCDKLESMTSIQSLMYYKSKTLNLRSEEQRRRDIAET